MLAASAVRTSFEDPLSGLELDERPEPEPPERWEVIEVRAASLNHHDLWTLRGIGIEENRLPIILGCDAAGITQEGRQVIVHAVVSTPGAADDETLSPESTILSERYDGTHAERVAVPSRNLIDKPPELSFAEAACLPTAYLTAYRMLFTRGEMRPGKTVLLQGAGGGVATAAILLGRAAGLRVWVTSRDPEKRQQALDLGAHGAFEAGERLPERVDCVLETVGEATWGHSLRALVPGGTLVVAGATSGANPPADLARVFFRQLRVIGSTMGTRTELRDLVGMLAATRVRPLVDTVIPLDQAPAAYERLARGETFGKIVLSAG
jgi:NADPH:quinone reductase-like Zn-dependent oxidoreductase